MAALLMAGVLSAEEGQVTATPLDPLSPQVAPNLTSDVPVVEETPATKKDAIAWPRGVFADVSVGTQGLGLDVGYSFTRYLKLRVRGTMLSYDHKDTWSDMDVKAKLKSSSCGLILDVHPFGGSFRLSAGLNAAPLRVEAEGNMDDFSSLGGKEYIDIGGYDFRVPDGVGSIRGRYKWDAVQPYFGFGWSCSSESEHAWFFTADIGVNIIGKGKLSVGYNGDVEYRETGTSSAYKKLDNSTLESAIREEGKDFFDIADKIVIYPVVHIGVGCRF